MKILNKIIRNNGKQLSFRRLVFLILIIIATGFMLRKNISTIQFSDIKSAGSPWYASYVDATLTPYYPFETVKTTDAPNNVVLSFIVGSSEDGCRPTWGNYYTLEEANIIMDLDRRIARLRQQGGEIVVSFGGLYNNELANSCDEENALSKAYSAVIDRYSLDTIDLDLEGDGLTNASAMQRRAKVISQLQKDRRLSNKNLAVWLTMPVTPQGLTKDGTDAIATFLANDVDITGVNIMTMNYGASKSIDQNMYEASVSALKETHRQLKILYSQVEINLSDAAAWRKLGATPMIGQNDVLSEIFTIEDAVNFNKFAQDKQLGRMSIWSANRDIECGENYVHKSVVSNSCSGVDQSQYQFANILSEGFNGDITSNASAVTVSTAVVIKEDDPATSPYQIWNENATYLEGTKVVWHGNVYQAKWWTQGDLPDNPVLQTFDTPWRLVGPVLPGETPIPQPTLPPGLYPNWSGDIIYQSGDRVLFEGIPYQAKWWTQGDSPAASSSQSNSTPWNPLTRKQIEELLMQYSE